MSRETDELTAEARHEIRKRDAEIELLRAALADIKAKGRTTGYGRAALANIADCALRGVFEQTIDKSEG